FYLPQVCFTHTLLLYTNLSQMQEKNPIFREILLLNLTIISFVKEF
ncbi:MAG: hypothetical protein Q616_SPPC00234G0004, partial [Streptococcus parasanguinis DORA_23_24]